MTSTSHVAELAGVRFRPSGMDALERAIGDALSSPQEQPLTIGYVNPHVITSAAEHSKIVEHLDACDHVCVDGIGVWLALRLWRQGIERLPAYRAADQVLDGGILRGKAAVIGIEPNEIEHAVEGIRARNSSIEIVGLADGFRTDREIATMISDSGPRVILIGAGSPRSEQVAVVCRQVAPNAVIFHVGAGTLKTWAGRREHAPRILSTLGIDWLYRYVKEPHTRARYRHGIPAFIRRVMAEPTSIVTQSAPVASRGAVPAIRSLSGQDEGDLS